MAPSPSWHTAGPRTPRVRRTDALLGALAWDLGTQRHVVPGPLHFCCPSPTHTCLPVCHLPAYLPSVSFSAFRLSVSHLSSLHIVQSACSFPVKLQGEESQLFISC